MKNVLLLFALSLFLFSCENDPAPDESVPAELAPSTPVISYRVAEYLPHDTSMFTEGLLFHEGKLYESTGSPENIPSAKSIIGEVDLKTGRVTKKAELDPAQYFGEGIVFLNGKVYQLTYKNRMGFIYDAKTFKQTGTFRYSNAEGWGLTTDGRHIIMSDGTAALTFLDPATMQPSKTVTVLKNGTPQDKINELEYIRGFIYANVWMTNTILKIDTTGKVVGELDLNALGFEAKNKNPYSDVLNGIAWDPATDKVYVTGKFWTNIYQIDFPH